jgi:hypothetical protein
VGVDGVDPVWRLVGRGTGFAYRSSIAVGGYMDVYFQLPGSSTAPIPVLPSTWYEAQVRLQAHRCTGELKVAFYDINNAYITEVSIGSTTFMSGATNGRSINDYALVWGRTQSPSNARYAMFFLRASVPTGTDPYMFWTMAYLGLSPGSQQTEPTPWAPGGLTTIEGGMIATDAVIARHIATDAVTAGKIAANAVTADKVAANAITSNKIASDAIQTRSLLVSPGNICPDGFFHDWGSHAAGNFWEPDAGGWYAENASAGSWQTGMGVRRSIVLWEANGHGTNRRHVWSRAGRFMPASQGQSYRLRANGRSNANQTIFCALAFYDWNNAYLGLDAITWTSADSAGAVREKQITAPAGSAYMRVAIFNDGGTTFTGLSMVADVQVEAAVTASMVVQGSAVITGAAQVGSLVVGTGAIIDESVTSIFSQEWTNTGPGSGVWIDGGWMQFNLPQTRAAVITMSWQHGYSAEVTHGARIKVNNAIAFERSALSIIDYPTVTLRRDLPAGTNRIDFEWMGQNANINIGNRTMVVLTRAK